MRTTFPCRPHERRISPRSRAVSVVRFVSSAAGSLPLAVRDELESEHRPEPAHLADLLDARCDLVQAASDPLAQLLGLLPELGASDLVEHRERGRAGDGVAAEGAAEPAGLGRVHHLGPSCDRGQWQPAAERLARDEQVRLDAVALDRPDGAGAADAGLDLVVDVERAVLPAELGEASRKVVGERDEPALALYRLDDDTPDLVLGKERLDAADRVVRRHAAVRVRTGCAVDLGARTGRSRACTTPCASSSSSAASGRGTRSRRRSRRAGRSRRARS